MGNFLRGMKQLREQATQAHFELMIELQEQPEEMVQELIQGKKSVSYGGNMYVGYRKGFMFPETDHQFGYRLDCEGKSIHDTVAYNMHKQIFIVVGALVLFGAGCEAPAPAEKPLEQVATTTPAQVTVIPEADFISNVMKSTPWSEYKDEKTGASFQYPVGFFTEAEKKGGQNSGMRYEVMAKPIIPEDGVCDGLGDVDCEIAKWPKRYANFNAALQGAEYAYGVYEGIPVAQKTRTVNGTKFVTMISQGINGACVLSYFAATPSAYAYFDINICDDPQLKEDKWFGSTVAEEERSKAKDILAGKNLSDSTKRKIQAMEQVLATLKMK